ncbi:hypothetical protein BDV59DRAFT_212097 [Aspergillus ambiguus]|uniref:ATP dependent DNA ligase domain protein n=1 Tax=Aspergillus ambiguus TaxID=176160 RepID=UPI003CCDB81A
MFPEKRTDRVYWLQDTSLARIVGRCLLLGSSRRDELERWRTSGGVDLGQCVENVMRQAENHVLPGQEVTIEEIDTALHAVASRCRFSGPRVRRQRTAVDVEEALSPLFRRLSSRDAKWLTRIILKSLSPVVLPRTLVFKSFHFLLPHLLVFQDSFEAALRMLYSGPIANFPPHPEPGLAKDLSTIALQHLDPVIGVKIGRPDYYKARSIKHCCQMVGRRRMSVERKYDGEYCQIHIDLLQHPVSIQIFSKSGKDSTADRAGIKRVIRDALGIGKPECKISRRCILEGEILVWSDKHARIADFHKLRKFVSRSGMFIGVENDSPPQPYEHLMIMFFDILLLDDDICLKKPHRLRRLLLKDIITSIDGRAEIAQQWVLDFARHDAHTRLESIFTRGITERWEGFVLKGCEDPYFAVSAGDNMETGGGWIKLKKDYIPGLGDTVDLPIIGGTYKARDALAMNPSKKLSWTHFFIGCLTNKESVLQSGAVPRFRVVDVIDQHCMSVKHMQILNKIGEFYACRLDSEHGFIIDNVRTNLPAMDTVFKTPFVVEMLGAGFEKPSGARFFALRFPRIVKIHSDRSFEDAASFQELQRIAEDARAVPVEALTEGRSAWARRLDLAGASLYKPDRSQSVQTTTTTCSQLTGSTARTFESPGRRNSHGLGAKTHGRSSHEALEFSSSPVVASTHPIPIYIDDSMTPLSSSDSEVHGNFLVDNQNLSHQASRKRKAPEGGHQPHGKHAKVRNLPVAVDSSSNMDIPEHVSSSPQATARSPLTTIPFYIHQGELGTTPIDIPTQTPDLDTFLTALRAANIGSLLGLSNLYALGDLLLSLTNKLSETLSATPERYSFKGKIFILDSEFLKLVPTANDLRLCLRETWSNIGREYFYTCVSWDVSRAYIVHPGLRDAGDNTPFVPQILVEWDEGELDSVGEFCLVHSRGGDTPPFTNGDTG